MKPYIVCCGTSGCCVIVGWCEQEPKSGEPCRVHRARMILHWAGSGGLLGVAARGPEDGSRLTCAVELTETSPVTEWVAVSEEAAERIDAWPAA